MSYPIGKPTNRKGGYTDEERIPQRQDEIKKALHRIFYAACLDDARKECSKEVKK